MVAGATTSAIAISEEQTFMVTTTGAFGFVWLWTLLAGAVSPSMFGGAPLDLDPKLSAIAPKECLWYVSYAGMGPADPNSANQTEKLLAEPQVQRFAAEIESQAMLALRRAGGPRREQRVLASVAPKLIKAFLAQPMAMYVEDVRPGDGGSVEVEAALVINAGDRKAEVESAVRELLALARDNGMLLGDADDASVKWHQIKTPPQAPEAWVGWQDDYLIVAVGKGTSAKVLKRMGGSAPPWLIKLREEHPLAREISTGYLNVARILALVKPLVEAKDPQAWPAIERLGLTSVRELHGVSGFDELGVLTTAHLVTDGQRSGLLALVPHKPLSPSDLEAIPKDAMLAAAKRIDLGEFWDNAVKLAVQFNPAAQEEIDGKLWEIESRLGISLRDDLVGSLGDVWIAYLPGGDLFSSWFNSAAAVRVKDPQMLRQAVGKLVDVARRELARQGNRAAIVDSTFDTSAGSHVVTTLQIGGPVPVAPSWCITDGWLAFGLQPQAVRSLVARNAADSLAKVDAVTAALADGPAVLIYQDTPRLVQSAYPWVQIGMGMLSGQLRREGMEINVASLPSMETIVKHLRPSVFTMSYSGDGLHFRTVGSIPSGGNIAGTAPVLAGLLVPAIQKARQAARDVEEMNNLRQLALAMFNYESAYGKFPTDVYGADGKPLLSWRVQLLPFLEELQLSKNFKLDEPWDSPHNLALLEPMPAVFQSRGDGEQPGKTRYLALKGDRTMWPGKQGIRFSQVTDGTSNTLLFVQTAPEAAVPWTKPADIDYDADRPFAGLKSDRGAFLASLSDGSVHRISLAIPKATLQALVTRDGGEVIEDDWQELPPGEHNDSIDEAIEAVEVAP